MPDPTNDIDSLIRYLDYLVGCDPQWARAVRALVAERDAAINARDEARRMISEINDENERLSDELKRMQEGGGA